MFSYAENTPFVFLINTPHSSRYASHLPLKGKARRAIGATRAFIFMSFDNVLFGIIGGRSIVCLPLEGKVAASAVG